VENRHSGVAAVFGRGRIVRVVVAVVGVLALSACQPLAEAAHGDSALAPVRGNLASETASAQDRDFHGVFEYAGNNSAADAADPDLAGVVLDYYWSQIEPKKGDYDWSVITDAMAPWVDHGKKIILRIATSGQSGWDRPYSGSGTPGWVYTDGAKSVSDNGETVPVYWNAIYQRDLSTFLSAYAAKFNGNTHVAFVEAGVGMGGETMPDTNQMTSAARAVWEKAGYTPALWLSTVERISTLYRHVFTRTPVYALLTSSFLVEGTDANASVNWTDYQRLARWYTSAKPAWGLQNDALSSNLSLPDAAAWDKASGLALEQAQATGGGSLMAQAADAFSLHADAMLVYRTEIEDTSNTKSLASLAADARPWPSTGSSSGSTGSSGSFTQPLTQTDGTSQYWLTGGDGGVFAFGGAPFYGSTGGLALAQPIVGMTATSDGHGYWFVARDGGVFNFGSAPFDGAVPGVASVDDVVGLAASRRGGYWVATANGDTYAFGGAPALPSLASLGVHVDNVVGIAATPDGGGYYLVASDGGIYALGDAVFRGSMGGRPLNQPIVGMAVDPVTGGYWEVASDGGIFAIGAPFFGSTGAIRLNRPVVGMAATSDGQGYWFVASDGGIFAEGDAHFGGSLPSIGVTPVLPVVGMAAD
jgi:hypothetical protein